MTTARAGRRSTARGEGRRKITWRPPGSCPAAPGAAAGARLVAALLAAALLAALAAPALAQPAPPAARAVVASGDTLARAASPEAALRALAARGYPFARVDSASGGGAVHVTPGPRVLVRSVDVQADSLDLGPLTRGWATREGAPLDSAAFASDLATLADALRRRGYADARFAPEAEIAGDPPGYRVRVRVREGAPVPLAGVVLDGAARASAAFAVRASGLRVGAPLAAFEPERVRRSVEATGAFAGVGTPTLARDGAGGLVVRVPVEPLPPGRADVVLGYLPPASGAAGQVVGTGLVELFGPFGGGRALRLALDRNPGLASRFAASVRDPFVAGLPFGAALAFEGEGRDSTLARQRLSAEASVRPAPGVEVGLTLAGEAVQPGRAGARPGADGLARVRRSDALWVGVALRYRSTDRRLAPRRGLAVETLAEQGTRALAPTAQSAPTRVSRQRLSASARLFRPLAGRLVGVLGADARLVLGAPGAAPEARRDEGELFRIGGAASLRGYDEEAFLGDAVGRALAELRLGLGGDAFAFAFGDLGAVRRPPLAGEPGETLVLPGYGLGAQLQTALGLVGLTYALNPELPPSRGKVHVRFAVGL